LKPELETMVSFSSLALVTFSSKALNQPSRTAWVSAVKVCLEPYRRKVIFLASVAARSSTSD